MQVPVARHKCAREGAREWMHLRCLFSTCTSGAASKLCSGPGGERPLRQSFSVDPSSVLHERNTLLVAVPFHKCRHVSGEWTARVPRSSLIACAFLLHACPPDMRPRELRRTMHDHPMPSVHVLSDRCTFPTAMHGCAKLERADIIANGEGRELWLAIA